jgi:hypothetical protein
MESLTWFEEVCRQLSREPAVATQVIREFQETREAYLLSRHFFGGFASLPLNANIGDCRQLSDRGVPVPGAFHPPICFPTELE